MSCQCQRRSVSGVTSVATSRKDLAAETVTVHRESTPLGIGQPKASPGQLLFEDAVLFTQVRDDLKLVAIDPARQGHEQNPEGNRVDHGPSLLGWRSAALWLG
jgi:hypothetical protein